VFRVLENITLRGCPPMNATVTRLRRRVLAALLFVLLAPLPGEARAQQPTDPGIGIRLLEAPQSRKDDPRARRFIVDHVNPGTSFTRAIEITNGTDRTITVALYSAAATLQNGEFVPASGRNQNELSGWVKIDPPSLTIPQDGAAQAKVTVAVPQDAQPGERYAVALAELPPPPGQGLVGLASRVGIRVYLSVGPGNEPTTDFDLKTFQPINEGGRPGVAIHSCNTGGRALDLGGTVKLANGPGGVSAGPFSSTQSATILPGTCQDLKILLDAALPRGPWDAVATLRSGTREKASEARITFPEPSESPGRAVTAKETGARQSPLLLVAIGLALLAGGAAIYALLRKRRRETPAPA
jgi:LPXTG-motif cell wall-anchored protein